MSYIFWGFALPSPLQEGDPRTLKPCRGQTLKLLPTYLAKVPAKELKQNGVAMAKVAFIAVSRSSIC